MRHSGLVTLALLVLTLWTDLGQGLPRSQATFARDMRGDVMYNVADTGNIAAVLSDCYFVFQPDFFTNCFV